PATPRACDVTDPVSPRPRNRLDPGSSLVAPAHPPYGPAPLHRRTRATAYRTYMRFDADDPGLVDFATSLARTPSVSTGEQAAVELAARRFRALGFDTVEIDPVGNAIGVFGSGEHPRLLIDGHIDFIPLHS